MAPNAAGWGELRGWGQGQNPCGGPGGGGGGGKQSWEGATCNGVGRVATIDLSSRHDLGGFEPGPALGNLTALTTLVLAGWSEAEVALRVGALSERWWQDLAAAAVAADMPAAGSDSTCDNPGSALVSPVGADPATGWRR